MPQSNREEAEILGVWWKEYGNYILFTIIAFLFFSIGWRYWQRLQVNQENYASIIYTQMVNSQKQQQTAEAKLYGEQLIKDYTNSIYASFAALFLAKEAVRVENWSLALDRLKFVIDKAPSKQIRQLARIRAARVLIEDKKPQQALELLAKVDDKAYSAAISEVIGDAFWALGKTDEAEQAYNRAKQSLETDKHQPRPEPLFEAKLQLF